MACSTRERKGSRTDPGLFSARDTVAVDTPAARATSSMVGRALSRDSMAAM
jgi:hypothetical protein